MLQCAFTYNVWLQIHTLLQRFLQIDNVWPKIQLVLKLTKSVIMPNASVRCKSGSGIVLSEEPNRVAVTRDAFLEAHLGRLVPLFPIQDVSSQALFRTVDQSRMA